MNFSAGTRFSHRHLLQHYRAWSWPVVAAISRYERGKCWSILSQCQRAPMSNDAGLDDILRNVSNARPTAKHKVAIGLGSNMGNRVHYIESALRQMTMRGLRVLAVSNLYQTKAMYYENQDSFVNGACYIETDMEPLELLDALQAIEYDLGRVRTIDKGPRTLDLDILLYDDLHIVNERLEVPHRLMLEREFVLRPLADIVPDYTFPVSFSIDNAKVHTVMDALTVVEDVQNPMYPVSALKTQLPLVVASDPKRTTLLMSVLNITPDSFSDGGRLSETDLDAVYAFAKAQVEAGATILDIGGQSTRPKADLISAEEELQRIIPVIEAVKSLSEAYKIAISVDTFHAKVAAESIRHGADIINDVSGGLLDEHMLRTVAEHNITIVLMHMRGNPQTMNQLTEYPDGVVTGVAQELQERVQAARRAGVLPWRIVLDPGIGFAKTQAQNLELMRSLGKLKQMPAFQGMPWLLGVSRKGFVGKITGVKEADKRGWGTAAAVTSCIAGGSDIVRVHDVAEMLQVTKMADAIYRTS